MRRDTTLLAAAVFCVGACVACSDDTPTGADAQNASSSSICAQAASDRSALTWSDALLGPITRDAESVFGGKLVRRAIDGDPRDVLPGIASREISFPSKLELSEATTQTVHWRIPIQPGQFPGVDRFVVAPRVGIPGVGLIELESIEARLDSDARGRFVGINVDVAGLPHGRDAATLAGTLLAAPEAAESIYETRAFTIPPGPVWLEYAFGVLDAGVDRGRVAFRLEVCSQGACECLHEETLDPSQDDHRGWQERAIPLRARVRGAQTLRFVARAERTPAHDAGVLLAEWARPRLLVPAGATPASSHDLILISLDTLRADHLGLHGYARDTSPYLDGQIASRAAVFDRAVAPATATGPSHMTMFTGLSPAVHGVTSNLSSKALPRGIETLAEVLRAHGYVTASINENGALSHRMGFDRGFDHRRQFFGANVMRPKGFVTEVFDEGLAFLARHPSQRFFLFLHTYQVHSPYAPPKRFRGLFAEGDDPQHPDNQRVGPGRRRLYPVNYDREIRHVDVELERLFEALDAGGWLDDAIVVITSDHGEAFGEHGTFGHGSDVFEESVHVPLVMLGPGVPVATRIAEPVGLIDLMPTLLELLGIPPPRDIMGRSFAQLLVQPEGGGAATHRPVVSENWAHTKSLSGDGVDSRRTHVAYRHGTLKLIRSWKGEETTEALYDLEADPAETRDLLSEADGYAGSRLRAVEALRALALARESAEAEMAARFADGSGPPRQPESAAEAMSPERLEALRMLGYVE